MTQFLSDELYLERPTLVEALDVCFRCNADNTNGDVYRIRLKLAVDQLQRAFGAHRGELEYRSWFTA